MENEIQPLEPQIEPSLDASNQQGLLPTGEADHEGAMAKADLFKLGQYSYKLFKKIEDDTQLEAWVQAKITKAADYIASVYHYMEYEMKFSEYGKKLDDSDVLSESQKEFMKNKLMEAKSKIRDLKIVEAKKSKTNNAPAINNFVAKNAQTSGAGAHQSEKDKLPRKAKHKNKEMQLDELSKETLKPYIKAASQDLVDKSTKLAKTDSSKKQTELGRKVTNRTHGIASATDRLEEASKDKTKKFAALAPPKDKITYADKIAGAKKSKELDEATKPSAGLSTEKKSATVKAAKAGKDIGKKGKGFKDVAEKATKQYGSKEKGEKVAAAAMWKNIKETTEMAFGEGVYEKDEQLDELNLKPWEKKSPFSKAGHEAHAERQAGKMKAADDSINAADEADDESGISKGNMDWMKAKKRKDAAVRKASLAKNESVELNESAELTRMKEYLTRLNG